jgi:hypothetical protein
MATFVTLPATRAWMQAAADLDGDYITFGTSGQQGGGPVQVDTVNDGEVREYASGRIAAMAGPMVADTFTVLARYIDNTTTQWLRNHIGDLCLYRDTHGERFWCVYFTTTRVHLKPYVAGRSDYLLNLVAVTGNDIV